MKKLAIIPALLLTLLIVSRLAAQTGGGYDLSWNTIDAGGGTSTGGVYSMSGTVGQADAHEASTGGVYSVRGGFWQPGISPLAITLAAFEAIPQGNQILLTWETVSETDNAGFNLYRATDDPAAPQIQLNGELIPSQGAGGQGAIYSWPDTSAAVGPVYYYWLEAVGTDGSATYYGPVSATLTPPSALALSDFGAAATAPWLTCFGVGVGLMALGGGVVAWRRRR